MVGYFYWGFLGDKKFRNGKEVSTPDGNAFYSWSIISELQKRGYDVALYLDQDKEGYEKLGTKLFKSFATETRETAYTKAAAVKWDWDKLDFVLLEWRWLIPGRNDPATKASNPEGFQYDREKMEEVLNECKSRNIPVVVFDLDYKLTTEEVEKFGIKYVIELGNKWKDGSISAKKIQIPFDFSEMTEKNAPEIITNPEEFTADVIYIGNRYERDWCIYKYLPDGTIVHGNWLEPGHGDPVHEFPTIEFRKRLSASEIGKPYREAVATCLLAKREYCEMGFMTARIQEAAFYGTVPFFIEEYGRNVIAEYAGKYADFLTVSSKKEVRNKALILKSDPEYRKEIISYMRQHLRFMDSKFFVDDLLSLLGK